MKSSLIRTTRLLAPTIILAGLSWFSAAAQTRPVPNSQLASKELNARVEALLKKMTLEEKIGQLVQFNAGFATGPDASNLKYDELAAKGQVGSFLNVVGAEATNHYQHIAMEKSRLHIPILFGQDVIHGHRTTFPVPLAIAASWDPAAAELVARTEPRKPAPTGLRGCFLPW
jgi:beta-glucosidase